MSKKHVIIIGSSSGIGKSLAKTLKQKTNYKVICGSHMIGDKFMFVDLTKRESIFKFISNLKKVLKDEKIDLLVLNSGIASSSALIRTNDYDLDKSFEINTINQVVLLREIADLLKSNSKVLFINSKSALITLPFLGIYAATKKANLAIADALRFELSRLKVKVVSVFIGNTKTKMWTDKFIIADEIIERNDGYKEQMETALRLGKRKYGSGMAPEYVADKLVNIINQNKPRNNYYLGKDAWTFVFFKNFLPRSLTHYIIKKQYGL